MHSALSFSQCYTKQKIILACPHIIIFEGCSCKEGNYPLNNLIPLGYLCKQRLLTVLFINKVFPLAKMSIMQISPVKNMG